MQPFWAGGSVGRFLDEWLTLAGAQAAKMQPQTRLAGLQVLRIAPSLQAQADSAEMGRAFSTFRITPKAPLQPAQV